ncbi:PilZ domain-containing protein [Oryzibacter oryziterrae]|uniref:PilZ domain-containing protein n=1 Tax=Oryzibacter oryziterrae TaxID=2766474 RepID=UPI001F3C34FD|nr:PilZ domain-containing protein [Oryzibacter oryziterrae]
MPNSSNCADMNDIIRQLKHPHLRVEDGRKHQRADCRWPATLNRQTTAIKCCVENISVGGCKIRIGTNGLGVGDRVQVNIPDQQMVLTGMIVWLRQHEAGVSFLYANC